VTQVHLQPMTMKETVDWINENVVYTKVSKSIIRLDLPNGHYSKGNK